MSELPYNKEVEEDCITGFMFFPSWVRDPDFSPELTAEDFYDFRCREIFKTMLKLNYRHELWGIESLINELKRTGTINDIGGEVYIWDLARRGVTRAAEDRHSHEPQHFAGLVRDYALRRAQLLKAQMLATQALDFSATFYKGDK